LEELHNLVPTPWISDNDDNGNECDDDDSEESYHTLSMTFDNSSNSLLNLFRKTYSPEVSDNESEEEIEVEDQTSVEESQPLFPLCKSELQAVPYMQTCYLVGGNRNKIKTTRVRVNKAPRKMNRKKYDSDKIPKNLRGSDINPPHLTRTFNFLNPVTTVSAPTASFRVKSYRINTLWDPDPDILTSGLAGFRTWMEFYEFYRVNKVTITWEPANNETFTFFVGYTLSNTPQDTFIVTRQEAVDALENGYTTKAQTLQNRNGGPSVCKLTRTVKLSALFGDKTVYYGDTNYIGVGLSDPVDLIFVNLIVIAPTNTTFLLNGAVGVLELRVTAKMFTTKTLSDAAIRKKRLKDKEGEETVEELKLKLAKAYEREMQANKILMV